MNSENDSQEKECKRITKSGFDSKYELRKPGDVREGTDEARPARHIYGAIHLQSV
jgi:hypothetical protein